MAKSGTLKSSKYGDRYLKFTWERISYNASEKQTKIKWTLKGAGGSGYYKAGNFLVKINGDTVYSTSQDSRIELWNGTTVKTGTKTITHASNGTKSFKVYIEAGIYTYAVNCKGEKTFTLDPFYDINFDANGGSGVPNSLSETVYNATTSYEFTIPITKPTRTGYKFLGYSTSNSDTSAEYLADEKIKISSNTTLYAIWERITLDVIFDAKTNGGLVNNNDTFIKNVYYGDSIGILPIAEKKNYKFIGWYTTPTGTVKITENLIITKDIILYARFELQANAYVKEENYKTAMTFIKENEIYKKGVVYVKRYGKYKEVSM